MAAIFTSSTFESMAAERDQGNDIHNDSISSANSRYVFSSDDEYRTASETSGGIRIQNKEDNFKCGEEKENVIRAQWWLPAGLCVAHKIRSDNSLLGP